MSGYRIIGMVGLLAVFVLIAVWGEETVLGGSTSPQGDIPADNSGGTGTIVAAGGDLAGILVGDAGALQSPGHFRYSPGLVTYVKAREGLRLKAYYDVKGYSIGYGHFLGVSARGSADMNRTCTEAQALSWLQSDLGKSLAAVNRLVTVKLTQGEVDALTDFQFSEGALSTSTLLQDVNNGNTVRIANDFMQYTRAGADKLALAAVRLRELAWTDWGLPSAS